MRRRVRLTNGHYAIPGKKRGKKGDTGIRAKTHVVQRPNGELVHSVRVIAENHELDIEYEKVRRAMFKRYPPPDHYHFCDNTEGVPV